MDDLEVVCEEVACIEQARTICPMLSISMYKVRLDLLLNSIEIEDILEHVDQQKLLDALTGVSNDKVKGGDK